MYAILNDVYVYKAKTPPEEDILIEELVVVLEERGVGHGGETLPQGSQPPGETYIDNVNDKTNDNVHSTEKSSLSGISGA